MELSSLLHLPGGASQADKGPKRTRMEDGNAPINLGGGDVEEDVQKLAKMMETLMKSALHSEQQIRQLRAINMITFKVTAESPWVETAKKTMQAFQQAQRAYKEKPEEERQKLGEPAAWIFNAIVKEVAMNSKHLLSQEKEAMIKSAQTWPQKGGLQYVLEQVPHFKITRMHQSDVKKIEVSSPLYQQKQISMELSEEMPPAAVLGLLLKDLSKQSKYKQL
eukprot:5869236-Karenia_brevis.AAC.1